VSDFSDVVATVRTVARPENRIVVNVQHYHIVCRREQLDWSLRGIVRRYLSPTRKQALVSLPDNSNRYHPLTEIQRHHNPMPNVPVSFRLVGIASIAALGLLLRVCNLRYQTAREVQQVFSVSRA
jgi:hypothetical protein